MDRTVKWGILGPGRIARSFAEGLERLDDAELVAVGSTSAARAREFGEEFAVRGTCGTYDEVLKDPEVEVVYVGTLNTLHEKVVLDALDAGKAVLCEKPLGINRDQVERMFRKADERDLFLMEAYWTRFLPAYRRVLAWIAEGRIGEIRRFTADFSFSLKPDPSARHYDRLHGGGALLDVGIYLIGAAADVFDGPPKEISSIGHICETGVDDSFSATLDYGDGRIANLWGSLRCSAPFSAVVYGTDGLIEMPDFWRISSAYLKDASGTLVDSIVDSMEGNGYQYEAAEVNRCLRSGRSSSTVMSAADSISVITVSDTLRSQWGLTYPGEQK